MVTRGREEEDRAPRRWLLGWGHRSLVPEEASAVCGEPDKARGRWDCAGGERLERYFGGGEVGGRGPGANWRGVSGLLFPQYGARLLATEEDTAGCAC